MKILVITACTADKKFDELKLPNQLKPADCNNRGLLQLKSKPLKEYETPAAEMYTGNGHLRVMNGVKDLRDSRYPISQDITIDVRIISPAYGLLKEKDPIVPYSYNFSDYPNPVIEQRSKKLKIHPKIECLLPSYDLAFFLLSEPYLTACILPFDVPKPPIQIFLVAEGAEEDIRVNKPHIRAVCVGEELDAKLEGANNYNRKQAVFERLCRVARDQGLPVFEAVKKNPQRIIEMVLACNRRR